MGMRLRFAVVLGLVLSVFPDLASEAQTTAPPALHQAARSGQTGTVRALLMVGANIKVHDKKGRTALDVAAVFAFLNSKQSEVVPTFLEAGVYPTTKDVNGQITVDLAAALRLAAAYGKPKNIRALLEAGANVKAHDKNSWTALQTAAWHRRSENVRTLLEVGADVNARSKSGQTALYLAAWSRKPETVRALLEAGADVMARTKNGETPLHRAAKYGKYENVRMLLKAGACINAHDKNGRTALHGTVLKSSVSSVGWTSNSETVRALLEAGADPMIKDVGGETAVDLAEENPEVKESDVYWELRDALWGDQVW